MYICLLYTCIYSHYIRGENLCPKYQWQGKLGPTGKIFEAVWWHLLKPNIYACNNYRNQSNHIKVKSKDRSRPVLDLPVTNVSLISDPPPTNFSPSSPLL